MSKTMLIDALHSEETRVIILDKNNRIEEFDFAVAAKEQIKSNIYLAKITRVEPSLQAAFVEYGNGKQGFLPFSEIHTDYYQIPVADREKLLEEQRQLMEQEEAEEKKAEESSDAEAAKEKEAGNSKPRRSRRKRTFSAKTKDDTAQVVQSEVVAEEESAANSTDTVKAAKAAPAETDTPEAAQTSEDPAVADAKDAEEKADTEAVSTEKETAEQKPDTAENAEQKKEAEATKAADTPEETTENAKGDKANKDGSNAKPSGKDADDAEEDEQDAEESVDTLDDDEDEDEISKKHSGITRAFMRRYKIQEVIKSNQIVLVQVIKEERGNKGASLTTYISLPGRYSVLMPNSPKGGGVSRKVPRGEERKRLRDIVSEMKEARGMSAIIRTAGIGRTKAEIKRDYEYLVKLWGQIRDLAISSTAPARVYEEGDIIKRSLRDHYTSDIETVQVQGETAYHTAKDFMKMMMPSHAVRVKHYKDDIPLFHQYGVEEQLHSMHQPIAKMKSGGYLVINPTEALISIDVNSGRSTSERNVEETALKTNLEAAAEVARQLRLRDLGGLVVIDFIDMYHGKNRRAIERALKDALKNDRAKIQVSRVSPFGLIEMSRQRLRPSIAESTTVTCPHCSGSGVVRSNASLAMEIVRVLEKEASSGDFTALNVVVRDDLAIYLLNHSRHNIDKIEDLFGVTVQFRVGVLAIQDDYLLERILPNGNIARADKPSSKRKRRSRKPRNNQNAENNPSSNDNNTPSKEKDAAPQEKGKASEEGKSGEADSGKEEKTSSRSRRGGRNRYPRRGRGEKKPEQNGVENSPADNGEAKPNKAEKQEPAEKKSDTPAKAAEATTKPATADSSPKPAKQPKEEAKKPAPKAEAPAPAAVPEDTPKKKGAARKGWWNRMVEK